MKKITTKATLMAFTMSLAAIFTSCESKSNNQQTQVEQTADAEKDEAATPTDDIFFYTTRHRADKFVPTESKMGFGSAIEAIGIEEFKGNLNLKEIWFGPKVNHIANNAFDGCSNIEKMHFQGKVAVINDEAFMGCTSLKNLNVDVYTIGLNAFKGCSSLQTARFGESIWWIREGAFAGCKNLRSVLMGITMQKLEDGAFDGCTNIEEFSIPNDFKNRLFGMIPSSGKWKTIYLLSTEYYEMPKNCTPSSSCTLFVPDAFLQKFQADPGWSKFGSIEPLSKTKFFTAEGFWK